MKETYYALWTSVVSDIKHPCINLEVSDITAEAS